MSSTPSPQQIRIAHALALAHGHLWASVLTADEAAALGTEAIEAEVRRRHAAEHAARGDGPDDCACVGGISAPTVRDDEIVHCTGSGRCEWVVGAEETTVSIHRPGGLVARGILRHGGMHPAWEAPSERRPVGVRHLRALIEALDVLGAVAPAAMRRILIASEAIEAPGADVADYPAWYAATQPAREALDRDAESAWSPLGATAPKS